jgi:hypothetical protein
VNDEPDSLVLVYLRDIDANVSQIAEDERRLDLTDPAIP